MRNTSSRIYNNLAYLSGILMIIGLHLPLYIISKGSSVELVYRTNNEGIFLLISALLVIIQKHNNRNKYFLVSLIFQIGMMVYYVILMRNDKHFLMLSWGFVCEIMAIVILMAAFLTKKTGDRLVTHDMSTMRVIKTDDYEYCDKIGFRDFSWIVIVIVCTTLVVILKLNIDKRSESLTSGDVATNQVKALEMDNSGKTNCDYENENYSVIVEDGYITNENGEEIVFIEVTLKNKTESSLVFNELFDIIVKQGDKELKRCVKVDSAIFDSNSSLAQISLLETSKVYIPFTLEDSQKNLKVSLNSIVMNNDTGDVVSIVKDKVVKINDLYYVDTLEEIITIGERKMDAEDKSSNKNDDNESVQLNMTTSTPQATETTSTATTTVESTQRDVVEDSTPEPEEQQTEETSQTQEPQLITGTVKFVRPDDWSEEVKVYLNIYEKENDVVEKKRIANSGYDNNEYTFFLTDIDMSENVYITFSNDSEMYPENNKKLVLVMGKKYTSN